MLSIWSVIKISRFARSPLLKNPYQNSGKSPYSRDRLYFLKKIWQMVKINLTNLMPICLLHGFLWSRKLSLNGTIPLWNSLLLYKLPLTWEIYTFQLSQFRFSQTALLQLPLTVWMKNRKKFRLRRGSSQCSVYGPLMKPPSNNLTR